MNEAYTLYLGKVKKIVKNKKSKFSYIFSINKIGHGKKTEKILKVPGNLALGEFDLKIRSVMKFDSWDHMSAFYEGKPHRSPEIATITPDGDGDNSNLTIENLQLEEGSELGYVYDFGDDVQCLLTVNEIQPL